MSELTTHESNAIVQLLGDEHGQTLFIKLDGLVGDEFAACLSEASAQNAELIITQGTVEDAQCWFWGKR